jgi:hypothetical protein
MNFVVILYRIVHVDIKDFLSGSYNMVLTYMCGTIVEYLSLFLIRLFFELCLQRRVCNLVIRGQEERAFPRNDFATGLKELGFSN